MQNIIFALGVKGLILILGAAGIATLWGAVFADVGGCPPGCPECDEDDKINPLRLHTEAERVSCYALILSYSVPGQIESGLSITAQHIDDLALYQFLDGASGRPEILPWIKMTRIFSLIFSDRSRHGQS